MQYCEKFFRACLQRQIVSGDSGRAGHKRIVKSPGAREDSMASNLGTVRAGYLQILDCAPALEFVAG